MLLCKLVVECAAESLWFWIFFCFVFWGECERSGFFLEGGNCSVQIQRKLNEGGRWKGLVETHCGFGFCE